MTLLRTLTRRLSLQSHEKIIVSPVEGRWPKIEIKQGRLCLLKLDLEAYKNSPPLEAKEELCDMTLRLLESQIMINPGHAPEVNQAAVDGIRRLKASRTWKSNSPEKQ